jgi:osmotically inducible protein OsmC
MGHLQARLNVPPGIEGEVAQAMVDRAHKEFAYSKATYGNINVVIKVETRPVTHVA